MMISGKAFPPLWQPYTQMQIAPTPLQVKAAKGSHLWLEDGRCLVDGIASWWTACHGYQHETIIAAIEKQLQAFPHVMLAGLSHAPAEALAEKLAQQLPSPLGHVFFSESGSVAVEVALKMAIQYAHLRGDMARTDLLAFSGGYHGDTLGTMAISDTALHTLYQGALKPQHRVALPESEAEIAHFEHYLEQHGASLAAMVIEPLLQGGGGMRLHTPATLQRVATMAKRYGILLICDEIFTGFGRTGTLFAIEQAGIVPDIIVLSKALTGGTLPLAATVASHAIFEAFLSSDPATAFMHGPTYMGHALACAAALASVSLFETEDRLGAVKAIERALKETLLPLTELPNVKAVRVLGAMGAIEFQQLDVTWARKRALELGVFLRPFSNILYTTPAFTISPDALESVLSAMEAITKEASLR